jgi:peptidoglycan/LPS O-acetylase OafA/YrhL
MFGCKNDPTKFILGHRIFSPLAKVSFCIYLVHFVVIMNGVFGARMDMYWEPYSVVYTTITYMFWATLFAVCLSLMVEAPTLGL